MPAPRTEMAPTRPGRHRMVVAKSLAESACPGFLSEDPHPRSHSPKGARHKHSPSKPCWRCGSGQRMTTESEPLEGMPMSCQIWASGQSSRHPEIRCLVGFAPTAEPGSEDMLRSDKSLFISLFIPPGSLPLDLAGDGDGGTVETGGLASMCCKTCQRRRA